MRLVYVTACCLYIPLQIFKAYYVISLLHVLQNYVPEAGAFTVSASCSERSEFESRLGDQLSRQTIVHSTKTTASALSFRPTVCEARVADRTLLT
jgi:hypothetical protein